MWVHWNTDDAIEKSSNASQSRNSDCGGLGVHKHLSGQKSYLQIQQELEEQSGRPVSLGEVFLKTHTKPDGSFVDQKAKQVVEAYDKNVEELQSQMDVDPDPTNPSAQESTHRTLTIQEKDDIFLKCTVTDDKGNPFGLGSLSETITKGKRKEYANSSSTSLSEIQEQLKVARQKLAEQDEENARRDREDARRDEEQRNAQNRITSLEMLVSYLRKSDPGFAEFMATQPPAPAPFTTPVTADNITPATAANITSATTPIVTPANAPNTSPASSPSTSPLSVTSSRP